MSYEIDPNLTLGAVSLSVADLNHSLDYYQQAIGLELQERVGDTASLGVGGATLLRLHHQPGAQLVRRSAGLYHFALRVPTRRDLACVIHHFADVKVSIDGAADHLVSEALYLSDPDGHGIEIYRDRPRDRWYDADGRFQMGTIQLDFHGIINELEGQDPVWQGLPTGTDMGHIHLQVADIAAAEDFYAGTLGMGVMAGMPSASFVSAGGYHHHVGMNTWAGVGLPPAPAEAARLLSYELRFSTPDSLAAAVDRIQLAAIPVTEVGGAWELDDPSGNHIRLLLN